MEKIGEKKKNLKKANLMHTDIHSQNEIVYSNEF